MLFINTSFLKLRFHGQTECSFDLKYLSKKTERSFFSNHNYFISSAKTAIGISKNNKFNIKVVHSFGGFSKHCFVVHYDSEGIIFFFNCVEKLLENLKNISETLGNESYNKFKLDIYVHDSDDINSVSTPYLSFYNSRMDTKTCAIELPCDCFKIKSNNDKINKALRNRDWNFFLSQGERI